MRALRLTLAVCAVALLAACAVQPQRVSSPAVAIAAPHIPAPVIAPLPAATPPDFWSQLRASFALDDCAIDPSVQQWARRFTRNPARFETQMGSALPLLIYVQNAAQRAGVPGEFVFLPMIESSYNTAEPGYGGDPAGMWQIMPQTARTLGLVVNRRYDGRLDPAAATSAVMGMLKAYGDELHDWRLVDMAFNTGEYRVLQLLDDASPARKVDAAPRLPVGAITRDHVAKLLAMACIVRDPTRFDVELPKAADQDQLTLVEVPAGADLAGAARLARVPLADLRALNPGYLGTHITSDAPHHLLLPESNARNLLAGIAIDGANSLAQADSTDVDSASAAQSGHPGTAHRKLVKHKVKRGESLWTIARRYHLDEHSLRTWNGLASDDVHPGQTLRLSAPD